MASSSKPRGLEHHQMGLRQYREGKYVEAISSFDKAITLGYKTFVVYDSKAAAMSKLEDWRESAYRHADKMILNFKNDKFIYKAYYRKADILRLMGRHTAASKVITEATPFLDRVPSADRAKHITILSSLRERIDSEHTIAKKRRLKEQQLSEAEYRAQLQKMKMDEAKSKINYVRLLPRDVLVNICEMGLENNEWFGMKMGAVCSAWRYAVMSQRGLWSSLSLGAKKPVQKAKYWLEKSQNRILELRFMSDFDVAREVAVGEMLDEAVGGIKRLEVLCRLRILNSWESKFRNLENLVIDSDHSVLQKGFDYNLCHPDSTTLRCIKLTKCNIAVDKGSHSGPLSVDEKDEEEDWAKYLPNLQILQLSDCQILPFCEQRLNLFRLLPNIQEIQWERSEIRPHQPRIPVTETGDLNMVSLERLTKYAELGPPARHLFDAMLPAPNLRELSLWAISGNLTRHLFTPGFKDSLSNLTALDIGKTTIIDKEDFIHQTLPKLSNLRFLNVAYCGFGDDFLQAISHRDGLDPTEQLLPNLTALSIAASDTVTTVGIRDFVNSRLPIEERFVLRKQIVKSQVKPSGAFRPTAPTQSVKKEQKPAMGTKRSMARTNSRSIADLGGLFAPDVIVARPSSASSSNSNLAEVVKPQRPSAFDTNSSSSREDFLTKSETVPELEVASVTTLTQSFFATQQNPPRHQPRPRISWLNLDQCELLDRDLIPLLESKVAFVSWWLGKPVEARLRGLGRWKWDKEVQDCGDQPCQMVPIPGQKGKFQVLHYCDQAEAVDQSSSSSLESLEEKSEPGWKMEKKECES